MGDDIVDLDGTSENKWKNFKTWKVLLRFKEKIWWKKWRFLRRSCRTIRDRRGCHGRYY